VLSTDGGDLRPLAPDIDVSSAASWSPGGGSIVAGGTDSGRPGLFRIPVAGGDPVRLTQELASKPVWSPDGSVIAYTGPVVGITGPLLLVHPDGTPGEATGIQVRVKGERYRFIPGQLKIVYIPGSQVLPEHFWLFDLATRDTRQLSTVVMTSTRTFDVTPGGKQIVFDRQREIPTSS
jgi:dipeptidyl aminopeptidase/acylaminoacyl peptidase